MTDRVGRVAESISGDTAEIQSTADPTQLTASQHRMKKFFEFARKEPEGFFDELRSKGPVVNRLGGGEVIPLRRSGLCLLVLHGNLPITFFFD